MRKYSYILFTFLLHAFATELIGQDYIFKTERINIQQGLPHRNITSIHQDKQNMIWVGTQDGIARIEGHSITAITKQNSQLRTNYILEMIEDNYGKIWLMSYGLNTDDSDISSPVTINTIDVLDPVTAKVSALDEYFKELNFPFKEKELLSVRSYKNGLWLAFKNHDYYFFGREFEKISCSASEGSELYVYPKDSINYFGFSRNEMFIINCKTGQVENFKLPKNHKIQNFQINGRVLLLKTLRLDSGITSHEIFYWNEDQPYFQSKTESREGRMVPPWNNTEIFPISNSKIDGNLVVQRNYEHLNITDASGKVIFNLENYLPDPFRTFKDFLVDAHQNLWITSGNGITTISINKNRFKNHLQRSSLPRISTRGIIKLINGDILVNSYSGTFIISKDSGNEIKIKPTEYGKEHYIGMGVHQDKNQQIWIANHGKELLSIDPSNYEATVFGKAEKERSNRSRVINYIFRDTIRGTLWIGTLNGLHYLDKTIPQLEVYQPSEQFKFLKDSEIYFIGQFDNKLYVGSSSGLFTMDLEYGIMTHQNFRNIGDHVDIRHIYQDDNGIFWLSTLGYGLIKWNKELNQTAIINTTNGLSNNVIHAAYEDHSGFLWLPTNNGLNRYDKESGDVRIFYKEDGLPENEFNWLSHYQDEEGNLYFGGLNGITVFNPDDFEEVNKNLLGINLLQFDVYNKNTNLTASGLSPILEGKRVIIKPEESHINLRFTLDNLIDAKNNRYAFLIEGLETEWEFINNDFLRLGRMPYGEYILKIKGQKNNGVWCTPIQIPILYAKPFYLSLPFYFLVGALLLFLSWLTFQWRTKLIQRRNTELELIVAERTKELTDLNRAKTKLFGILSHDLRRPLTSFKNLGAKVQYLIRKGEWQTLDQMADQIESHTENLNSLLENLLPWVASEIKNGNTIQKKTRVYPIFIKSIDDLKFYIAAKRINIEYDINRTWNIMANSDSVRIIIRNIIANAIKYSPEESKILCTARKSNGTITIIFTDYGVGINPDKLENIFTEYESTPGLQGEQGHGLGLKLSKDLALSNNGDLLIKSEPGKGTTVQLILKASLN